MDRAELKELMAEMLADRSPMVLSKEDIMLAVSLPLMTSILPIRFEDREWFEALPCNTCVKALFAGDNAMVVTRETV